ncbi:MAG: molybdopterin-dependent oxidoreductase [Lutispora sp.]|nr:molybdopterin-dependent oxidoreductase [Lutispora sp.]
MKKRGKGIGATFYGTGYGNGFPDVSNCEVELNCQGKIVVYTGATEVGQGAKTVLSQIAAEVMGVDLDSIVLVCEDTCCTPDAGTAAASRQTYNTGNGVRLACIKLKEMIKKVEENHKRVKGLPDEILTMKEIYEASRAQAIILKARDSFTACTSTMDEENGQGSPYWPYTFSCYAVEVEVDTETGRIEVLNAYCAQDVGKAINPVLIEGQIEGGFAMGMSWTLYEDLNLNQGIIKNNNFSKYIIPTSMDMPDICSIIVEDEESTGPYGAKGIGEPVMLAAMPAILNAIHDAVGIRVTKLPASPDYIVKKIQELDKSNLIERK